MASNEYCVARQRTRKREGGFRPIYFIVGGKVWNMDRGTGMRLRKVRPQCSTVIHARRSICECGHAFTLKREARNTASSPAKRKRALESLEDTLRRQENNRTRMASMRSSETQEQTLERLEQKRTHVASIRASEGLLSLPPLKKVIYDERNVLLVSNSLRLEFMLLSIS